MKRLSFNSKSYLELKDKKRFAIYRINALEEQKIANMKRLPFSIKVVLENLLRHFEGQNRKIVKEEDVIKLANWQPVYEKKVEIPYFPSRVVMQDFTGVPAVVDLAAMRDAMKALGKDPKKINPAIPVDLVVDHSIQVDYYGTRSALMKNMEMEYQRNRERYSLLKWAQKAFQNFRIFPSGAGIIHQVNLEYISRVVTTREIDGETAAFPDTLIGTDSHTTMIDGIGIVGWGVGGIEAESVMLGQPLYMKIPEVIGFKLTGQLPMGATATDLVLTITQILRKENVVEKFVEFFGTSLQHLPLPDRATIANMSPEYGATMGFFPVDAQVLQYLETTNRAHLVELVETYTKEQGLFHYGTETPDYTKVIELNLESVEPSLAGPGRPQDRISLYHIKPSFSQTREKMVNREPKEARINLDGEEVTLTDGSLVIAAITSCTNTSNPAVMIGAGLLAKKAVEKGLTVRKYVKTSFAPGSRVVGAYLDRAGLMPYLEKLGFNIVGYGCTTCIGNSGPLRPEIEKAIRENNLVAAAVLSGNRNFEARIHQRVRANYLASPILVVAFALTGKINIDINTEPLGTDTSGNPVFLEDIRPSIEEIHSLIRSMVTPDLFDARYKNVLEGDENWKNLEVAEGDIFAWDENSTYIRKVPFFHGFTLKLEKPQDIVSARALLVLGDSVTTDHISPAGAIPQEYPAGQYLIRNQVEPKFFNSYGSRRGNHEVMMRGTFANIRIKNKLVAPREGGYTLTLPDKKEKYVYDAAREYMGKGVPLIAVGGKEYGSGSSRDWAAKGSLLLGIRAVIAESYERIHRSNLIGMGVLPLEFEKNTSWESLGLTGTETFTIQGISDITPGKLLKLTAVSHDGKKTPFIVIARLDTEIEVEYYKNKGILPYVLREMVKHRTDRFKKKNIRICHF
ncbi:MAG: aconitate hydratase AcnA [Candidatus Aminicenantes bacterium]|nr:MAG: aconitate hydratase AcnA [Candidatus Aminicenantes bacterium]